MPLSPIDQAGGPGKSIRHITRRHGACIRCKAKKTRCEHLISLSSKRIHRSQDRNSDTYEGNGEAPCSACGRSGQFCNYESRQRKSSFRREIERHPSNNSRRPLDRTRCDATLTPRSVENENIGDINMLRSPVFSTTSGDMLPLDLNMDFFLASEPASLQLQPTAEEEIILQDATTYDDRQHDQGILGAPSSTFNYAFSPLRTQEAGASTRDGERYRIRDPWPMLEKDRPLTPFPRKSSNTIEHSSGSLSERRGTHNCRKEAEVDFRFTTLFGLAYLPTPQQDSNKHHGIQQILSNLASSAQNQELSHSDPDEDDERSPHSLWRNEDHANLRRYINACFESTAELQLFLRKSDVDKYLLEARQVSQSTPLLSMFSDAITAIGYSSLCNQAEVAKNLSTSKSSSKRYFHSLLNSYSDLYKMPSSLLKLQTSLLLIIISSNIRHPRKSEILMIAVHCIRELRFTSSSVIHKQFESIDDQILVKRSVWVLYCLDTSHSIHHGMSPLLHFDFVDHLPDQSNSGNTDDPLILQVCAARLLATIYSRIYSRHVWEKSTKTLQLGFQACALTLRRWHNCLSYQTRQLLVGRYFQSLYADDKARLKLRLFCYYHESVYLLFGPWIRPALASIAQARNQDVPSTEAPESANDYFGPKESLQKCLDSAYTIVANTNEIITIDKTLTRRLSNLMMISLCIIVYDIQFGDETTRKRSMTYLGICCGVFGSLHLADSSLPFEEILDLVRILRSPG